MKKFLLGVAFVFLGIAGAGVASAGPIEGACLRSDRNAANQQLCSCIQRVANVTLNRGDQKRAASFFKDPDKAQDVRMSQSRRDDEFWDRYKVFGEQAAMACQG